MTNLVPGNAFVVADHRSHTQFAVARNWRTLVDLQGLLGRERLPPPLSQFERPRRLPLEKALELSDRHEPPAAQPNDPDLRHDMLVEEVAGAAKRSASLIR